MGNEQYNDRLEEIFAQKLDQASSEPALWSTPSEDIWLGVDAELRKKRRDRRLLILFLFLFGLMVGFFLFGNQLVDIFWTKEAIEIPVVNNENLPSSKEAIEGTIATSNSNTKQEESLQNTIEPDENQANIKSISSSDLPPSVPKDKTVLNYSSESKGSAVIASSLEKETRKEAENIELTNIELTAISGVEHDAHEVYALSTLVSQPTSLLDGKTYIVDFAEKLKQEKKDAWIVEASGGAYNSLRNYPISTPELDLEITPTNTYAATINIEKVIHTNWSIGFGISYTKADFDANYDLTFAYSKANEQETTNGFEKAYRHTLPSLLTPLDAQFVLVRSTAINEGEDIPLSLRLSHGTQQLSVPIYTKYRIHRGNWSYYVKAGLAGNMLLSSLSTDHITTESHHDAIHARSSSFEVSGNSNPIQQNDFSLSFLTSIGAQLHLRDNFYLLFEPTFSGEIIATYPNAATGDKIINLGGQVGVGVMIE